MSERDVLKELSRVETLPALPDIVTRVLAVLDAEDTEMSTVSDLISQDPVMTGQLLRSANSVFYNASGMSTTSVHEAVGRIGLREVRNLVVSLGVVDAFDEPGGSFDFIGFWRHCFTVAVASGKVAMSIPSLAKPARPRDNPYFLAGLLHDIGTLLLCDHLGEEYLELIALAEQQGLPLHELEREHLGADHQQVGAALIRRWGLPLEVAAAAEHHHHASDAPDDGRDYVLVVSAADVAIGQAGRGSPAERFAPADDSALAELGIGADELAAMAADVALASEASDSLLAVALAP